jgi:hypothetical protein
MNETSAHQPKTKEKIMPEDSKAETPKTKPVPKAKVKVRVVKQPLHEDGRTYLKGEVIETDPDRAEALGELVVPAS